jgi:hypothetical protein
MVQYILYNNHEAYFKKGFPNKMFLNCLEASWLISIRTYEKCIQTLGLINIRKRRKFKDIRMNKNVSWELLRISYCAVLFALYR